MVNRLKNYTLLRPRLRKLVGLVLIAFGLFALIMPLVPGAVLAIVGFELIGIRLAFFERFFPPRLTLEPTTENTPLQ